MATPAMLQAGRENEDMRTVEGESMQSLGINVYSMIAQAIAFVILAATLVLTWLVVRALAKKSRSN